MQCSDEPPAKMRLPQPPSLGTDPHQPAHRSSSRQPGHLRWQRPRHYGVPCSLVRLYVQRKGPQYRDTEHPRLGVASRRRTRGRACGGTTLTRVGLNLPVRVRLSALRSALAVGGIKGQLLPTNPPGVTGVARSTAGSALAMDIDFVGPIRAWRYEAI